MTVRVVIGWPGQEVDAKMRDSIIFVVREYLGRDTEIVITTTYRDIPTISVFDIPRSLGPLAIRLEGFLKQLEHFEGRVQIGFSES